MSTAIDKIRNVILIDVYKRQALACAHRFTSKLLHTVISEEQTLTCLGSALTWSMPFVRQFKQKKQ